MCRLRCSPAPTVRSHIYLGSPAILRLPSGELIATADRFGPGFKGSPRNVSLYRDNLSNGSSWQFHTWVLGQYWSNLFEQGGAVWLLGTATDGPAPIKISRSPDGLNWPDADTAILSNDTYNTGPTPTLLSGGRLYRAMERFRKPYKWGKDYEAMCIHADATADLLDPASWTVSASLPLDPKWFPFEMSNAGYLEGNMVEGPAGELYNILRLNSMPEVGNKAVRLRFDSGTNAFAFDKLLDLPGGHTKFVIHKDPATGLYWTLSNLNTDSTYTDQRNLLVLAVSPDTTDWHVLEPLLYDDTGLDPQDSVRYTGFHYVDWQFDGPSDLIYAVRTGYRGSNSYHNSNRLTYKRLPDFRAKAKGLLGLAVAAAALSPPFDRVVTNYTATVPANATEIRVVLAVKR